jgi:hypothetical protein
VCSKAPEARSEGAEAESEDQDGVSAGYQAGELVIRSSGMQFRPLDDVPPTEILQSSRDR